ncbi:MAG: Fic family protein [Mycoplasmoidaceae bacterium]|nr:MAG: Fic family protein [Mycoplasmoidaceae bacterium]
MSRKYDSIDTTYTYKNGTFKNRYGIKSEKELDKVEGMVVLARIASFNITTQIFNFKYICVINKYLFSDVYDWAGEIRKVDISKGNTRFCNCNYIKTSWEQYVQPKIEEFKSANDKIKCLAEIFAEINLIHPFREGNGRTTKVFIAQLTRTVNINLQWENINAEENLKASIASVNGNIKPLIELLNKCIVK